jgi:hypothetical protein
VIAFLLDQGFHAPPSITFVMPATTRLTPHPLALQAPMTKPSSNWLEGRIDIPNRPDERVHPGTGGMSVTPDDPARLLPHVRPRWLGGQGKLPVFALDFGLIAAPLGVRLDPSIRNGALLWSRQS